MRNILFYLSTVLIWGSTWLAITFQLGVVDPMVSVAYRFTLASVILMAWCFLFRLNMRFSPKQHLFMGLQGAFLFALNYWLFYLAELHITSGLAAVLFSTILVMNMVNGYIFLGMPFDSRVITGGSLGLLGIILVFKPELSAFSFGDQGMKGILFSIGATFLASIGNILSAHNQKNQLPVIQTNAYGMAYGAILMLLFSALSGKTFTFVMTMPYIISLFYLAVFGSIIAFGCYLTLVGRIGADRAAYATLLFPIVALVFSTIWEGYQWSSWAMIGVFMILCGNLILIRKKKEKPPVSMEILKTAKNK